MNTTQMTGSQITKWMLERLAEATEITPRGATSIDLKADNFNPAIGPRTTFRIYNAEVGHSKECDTVSEAMASFRIIAGNFSPAEKAREYRDRAAKLLANAAELESATNGETN